MSACVLFYYLPILPEIDTSYSTHALSNVAHVRLPIGNLQIRGHITYCACIHMCSVRNAKWRTAELEYQDEDREYTCRYFVIFFRTVAPAPFLVVALATLGTGENFLISEGHL